MNYTKCSTKYTIGKNGMEYLTDVTDKLIVLNSKYYIRQKISLNEKKARKNPQMNHVLLLLLVEC